MPDAFRDLGELIEEHEAQERFLENAERDLAALARDRAFATHVSLQGEIRRAEYLFGQQHVATRGVDGLTLYCNREWGDGLSACRLRMIRARLCDGAGLGLFEANALRVEDAARRLEGLRRTDIDPAEVARAVVHMRKRGRAAVAAVVEMLVDRESVSHQDVCDRLDIGDSALKKRVFDANGMLEDPELGCGFRLVNKASFLFRVSREQK